MSYTVRNTEFSHVFQGLLFDLIHLKVEHCVSVIMVAYSSYILQNKNVKCNTAFSFVCYELSCFELCRIFPYITSICTAYLTLENMGKTHTGFSVVSV